MNVFIPNHNNPTTKLQSGTRSTEIRVLLQQSGKKKTTFSFLGLSFLFFFKLILPCEPRVAFSGLTQTPPCGSMSAHAETTILAPSQPSERDNLLELHACQAKKKKKKKSCLIASAAHDSLQLV